MCFGHSLEDEMTFDFFTEDHRTNFEDSNAEGVLDGELENLIKSFLLFNSSQNQV